MLCGTTMRMRAISPGAAGPREKPAPVPAPPIPLDEAIARGQTTDLQRAALEHGARENRRSLAAEIRAALHRPTV
jgi:hypothetical protein